MERIRALSDIDRRSLNSEMIVILEKGLDSEIASKTSLGGRRLAPETQTKIWERLCGAWEDKRSAKQISDEILKTRTAGRKVAL